MAGDDKGTAKAPQHATVGGVPSAATEQTLFELEPEPSAPPCPLCGGAWDGVGEMCENCAF